MQKRNPKTQETPKQNNKKAKTTKRQPEVEDSPTTAKVNLI
jgi:hypothetical protein